ncbi:MAG: MarR family transcriptional regulator [Pleurocapsa sp. SU_196_0]|nr:MarR family transcriptional regulator [Pleurocapsa sp. SU_196_0]
MLSPPAGQAFTDLVLLIFQINGALLEAGDRMTAPVGQTSARWQIMGCIDDKAMTVSSIARVMGLARQSVQRTADLLVQDGLAVYEENRITTRQVAAPHSTRSKRVERHRSRTTRVGEPRRGNHRSQRPRASHGHPRAVTRGVTVNRNSRTTSIRTGRHKIQGACYSPSRAKTGTMQGKSIAKIALEEINMGLAERRAVKAFQDNKLPTIQSQIDAAVGKPVPLEINWEQLALEEYADRYEGLWMASCFEPLVAALGEVGSDDLGREALQESLKSIRILGEYAHALKVSFSDGVLTLDFRLWNPPSADEQKDFTKNIRTTLESAL